MSENLTMKDISIIMLLYEDNTPVKEITSRFNIHRNMVYRIAKENNLKRRHIPFTENDKELLVDLWRDRLSYGQMANKLNRSVSTIQFELKKLCLID